MMASPDAAVLEVPTIPAGSRTQWILLAGLLFDLLIIGRNLPGPFLVVFWALIVAAVVVAVLAARRGSKRRPAVRVTPGYLQIPIGESSTVDVDWPDIATFAISRRRLVPHLMVEPVDPDRVRPAPSRWDRVAATRKDHYQLRVALGGDRATRAALRAELTARIP